MTVEDWSGRSNAGKGNSELLDEDGVLEFAAGIVDGACVLDVGCGRGRFAQFVPAYLYTGCDADANAIKRARELFPKHDFLVWDFRNGGVPHRPEPEIAVLSNLLVHQSDEDVRVISKSLADHEDIDRVVVIDTMESRTGDCGGIPCNNRLASELEALMPEWRLVSVHATHSVYLTKRRGVPTDTHVALFARATR